MNADIERQDGKEAKWTKGNQSERCQLALAKNIAFHLAKRAKIRY